MEHLKSVIKKKYGKRKSKAVWPEQFVNSSTGKNYRPHNEEEKIFVYDETWRYGLLKGGEGAGKGLPLDTVVPTPTGYDTIGDINPGDIVFDENGNPTNVLKVFGPFYEDCYKLTFDTGETIVTDKNHLWLVEDYNYRRSIARRGAKYPERTQAVHNLSVLDTQTVFENQRNCYKNRANYSIKLAKPLNLPEKTLKINPYLLGAWLGDGTSRVAQITIGLDDQEDMFEIIESLGHKLIPTKDSRTFGIDTHLSTFRDIDGRIKRNPDSFFAQLDTSGLLENKHIPTDYLRGSYEQRLFLLQGLMDTDGTIDDKGRCEFCSVSQVLSNQVYELCLSLGIKTNVKKGTVKYNGGYRTRYRLFFTPAIDVFRLKRKKAKIQKEGKQQQNRKQRRFIVKVEKVESVATKCIQVDSPNHLFLVTEGMIPTHNSVAGIVKNLNRLRRGMSGIMGCVSGDTMVNGIPIAEIKNPYFVETSNGLQPCSSSFCKGKADLYKVTLEDGKSILATMFHKFYKWPKWIELKDLKVGDFIATKDGFSAIKEIKFSYFGEYYDLTVPVYEHYIAQGIFNHNSPDLEHFKKSLWPEFRNWCPWHLVVPKQQYRKDPAWEPSQSFTLVFRNEMGSTSRLICGGFKESEIISWEGPNVSFVHFDEARRHRQPGAIKVFDGRCRIEGPKGEQPQVYFTTTPRKHWLFDYFGPVKDNDPLEDFKKRAFVATVSVYLNRENLSAGYIEDRALSLTEQEKRILMEAEWEDESDVEKFIKIIWWDNCKEELPPLTKHEPLVIALDAAEGTETGISDFFALSACSRHPADKDNVAVRYTQTWQAPKNGYLDYRPIKEELARLCKEFSVIEIAYDPYQLHDMANTLGKGKNAIGFFRRFSQGTERLEGDKHLQDLIISKRISHDGDIMLREHIDNANMKKSGEQGKLRIVKRTPNRKIDLAVATSMAAYRILYYNL